MTRLRMKALTIKQPWAWLIAHGYKDIENRSWYTPVRERVLIHASKTFDLDGHGYVRMHFPQIVMPIVFDMGGVVGEMTITGCVRRSPSAWFFGPFGFTLEDARPLPFIPLRGQMGFFDVKLPTEFAA